MSLIKLQGNASGTGAFTIAAPNGNTDRTLTLPDATGTVLAAPAGAVTINSSAPANSLTVDASGNLGIGTSSPTADLSVGSTTTSSGDVHLRTSKTAVELTPSNSDAGGMNFNVGFVAGGQGPLRFSIGSTERVRIDSDGLKFNGDTAAANALNDYEEGVWSPVIRGTGSDPTVTVSTANTGGVYTKIGDMVFVSFEVRWSAISGGSGNAYISGLPFARNSTQQPDGDRGVLDYYSVTVPSGGYTGVFSVGHTQTNLNISFTRSGAATIDLPVGNLINTNPGFLRGSLAYKTT